MAEFKPEELVNQVLSAVKGKPDQLNKILGGDTAALTKLIPNVKLDASQLTSVVALLKKSSLAKEILGADGKLDASDISRLAKKVNADPDKLIGAAASLLKKK